MSPPFGVKLTVSQPRARRLLIMALLVSASFLGCKERQSTPKTLPSRWISVTLQAGPPSARSGLTGKDFKRLRESIPKVQTAVLERHSIASVTYGQVTYQTRVCETTADMQSLLAEANTEIASGRFLNRADVQQGHGVVVLSNEFAEQVFADERAIGKTLMLGDREVQIVGVLGKPRAALITLDHDVYTVLNRLSEPPAPDTVGQSEQPAPSLLLDRIWIGVGQLDEVAATQQIVQAILKRSHPDVRYRIRSEYEVNQPPNRAK